MYALNTETNELFDDCECDMTIIEFIPNISDTIIVAITSIPLSVSL